MSLPSTTATSLLRMTSAVFSVVYVTVPNQDVAKTIARQGLQFHVLHLIGIFSDR